MKIAGTYYNLNHKALEIYLSGCDGACKGCHNPKLWDFNIGYDAFGSIFQNILQKLHENMVRYLWILGGEPLQQDLQRLEFFLATISHLSSPPIMLWTRETIIPDNIKKYIKYAKIGEYKEDYEPYTEPMFGITLASSNQKIIKINS